MTDLNFAPGLRENQFAYDNDYYVEPSNGTGLFFSEEAFPYVMRGGKNQDESELRICTTAVQFRNRALSVAKLKELLNICSIPILVDVRKRSYLIGKGFISEYKYTYPSTYTYRLLFVACSSSKVVTDMKDIKFFIDRKLYSEENKAFHGIIKEILQPFVGDVIICNDVLSYIGTKINIPQGGSIATSKLYTDSLVRATFTEIIKKKEQKKPVVVVTSVEDTVSDENPWEDEEEFEEYEDDGGYDEDEAL